MIAGGLVFVTDFADQAVMLPVAAGVALTLALGGDWRLALRWILCIGAVLGTALVAKLALHACLPAAASISPSGHTAAATVVFGGLAVLATRGTAVPGTVVSSWAGVAAGGLVGAVIAATRVALGLHSVAEIVLGGLDGLAGLLAFAFLARPSLARPGPVRVRPVGWACVAVACLIMAVMHGARLQAEQRIETMACRIGVGVGDRPDRDEIVFRTRLPGQPDCVRPGRSDRLRSGAFTTG